MQQHLARSWGRQFDFHLGPAMWFYVLFSFSLSLLPRLLRFLVYSLLLRMRRSVVLLFPCLIVVKTLGSEQQLLSHLVLSCSFLCIIKWGMPNARAKAAAI
jgi:signal transduction histidine kinase